MAKIITMPRLSDTMTEGVVAKWLKKVGDKINEGDILAEIETDKATMEFESFNSGTLLHIGIQEGETAPVDALLAIIGTAGEDIAPLLNASKQTKPTAEAPVQESTKLKLQETCCRNFRTNNQQPTTDNRFAKRSCSSYHATFERHHDRRNCSYLAQENR